jgi:hypothetical protein
VKPPSPYDVVMPISRTAAFYTAKKRERKALLDFFERLARDPFTETEWVVTDAAGRPNCRAAVGRFLVTFWADHAAREVRIVKIERVE